MNYRTLALVMRCRDICLTKDIRPTINVNRANTGRSPKAYVAICTANYIVILIEKPFFGR
jgi:hypothetical protein